MPPADPTTGPARPVSWLSGIRPYLLLTGLCLLLYLPGIASIPPLDRDEARFAQATRQMLETGDFLNIRFQDEARNRKPAGIYWLQAGAVAAFSTADSAAIWPYRLPSLLGAIAAVLLIFGFGGALLRDGSDVADSRRAAFIAALLLAAALEVVAEAHIAKTDAALLAAVVAGQGALGLTYLRSRDGAKVPLGVAALFWIAETVAILLKGPVGLALAIVTAGALSISDRELRWLRGLRPVAGPILMAAILAPWLIAIETATGGRFLSDSLGRDLLAKLVGPQESHGAPPLYYLVLAMASFWPGSLFLVPALIRGWRRRDAAAERFLLCWIVPAWFLIELVPTKLPHYALPLYPALALLAGAALADGFAFDPKSWARRIDLAVKAVWVAATLALAAAMVVLPVGFNGRLSVIGAIGALVLIGLAAALLFRRGALPGAAIAVAATAVFVVAMTTGVLPGLDRVWLSRAAAALVAEHKPAAGMPLVAVGYSEPSLVFLLGTGIRLATPGAAAAILARGGNALVGDRDEALLRRELAARGLIARAVGNVAGINYSNGQAVVLTLYVVEPG